MAVADTIQSIKTHLSEAYNKISDKGGNVPAQKNMNNLTDSIDSIGSIEPGPYGLLTYYDGDENNRVSVQLMTSDDFNQLCGSDGGTTSITINGHSIVKQTILEYQFGDAKISAIPSNFLRSCTSLRGSLTIPEGCTEIGNDFLRYCSNFTGPLTLPTTITTLGSYFLSDSGYAETLDLSNTKITTTPNYLLYGSNTPLPPELPTTCTSIGANFCARCKVLAGSSWRIPSSITTIGSNFLNGCSALEYLPILPAAIKSIGNDFCSSCTRIDSVYNNYSFPDGIQSIGSGCFQYCSRLGYYNKQIILPTSLKTIGANFMNGCSSYIAPLSIPSSVTQIGDGFLSKCFSFLGPLRADCPASVFSATTKVLTSNYNTAPEYVHGVTISGPYATAWKSALPNLTASPYRKLI